MIKFLSSSAITTVSKARYRTYNSAENIGDLSGRFTIEEELSRIAAEVPFSYKTYPV